MGWKLTITDETVGNLVTYLYKVAPVDRPDGSARSVEDVYRYEGAFAVLMALGLAPVIAEGPRGGRGIAVVPITELGDDY